MATSKIENLNAYVLKDNILGIRTYTQHVDGRLRYVDIALPSKYANKDTNNYFVSVMPTSETGSTYQYFISKYTGYFRVYVRDVNQATESVWMDIIVNIRNPESDGLTIS